MPGWRFHAAVVAVALAIGLCASPVGAQSPEAMFRAGVADARAGDYERAIEHFEAARAAGLDTGALYFNLGVAYYHTGQVAAAQRAFRRATPSGSMLAPAHYQLGRIARERGDLGRAREHFRMAARRAQTDELRSHAHAALAGLPQIEPPRHVYLSLGAGYDSNIALTPSDASGVSEESDAFAEAVLVARRPIDERHFLRASAYLQEYIEEDDFGLTSVRAGVGRVGRLDGWRFDLYLDGRHQRFGSEPFENSLIGGGQLSRPVGEVWSLELGYRLEYADGASGFGYLDGWRQRFDTTVAQSGGEGWEFEGWAEQADRDDRDTSDDFFSFSWTEVGLAVEYAVQLNGPQQIEFGLDGAHREYEGAEVRNGSRLDVREDDRLGLNAALMHRLDRDWSARVELRLDGRDSNLDQFDYGRRVIRAEIERVF